MIETKLIWFRNNLITNTLYMKKHLSVLVFISAFLVSNAQQDYQITHYMFDNISYNPVYAGMNNNICGTILGRQQWAGFEGSPKTMLLSGHTTVYESFGAGILLYRDDMGGAVSQTGFELTGSGGPLLKSALL